MDTNINPDATQVKNYFEKGVKRRRLFTIEDDVKLKSLITSKMFRGWKDIAKQMPKFSPKQLRDRWHNYISPDNNFEPYTMEEDAIIAQKVAEIGTKWSVISSILVGRSDNSVKNRYNTVLKNAAVHKTSNVPQSIKETKESNDSCTNININENKKRRIFPGIYYDSSLNKCRINSCCHYFDPLFMDHFFQPIVPISERI